MGRAVQPLDELSRLWIPSDRSACSGFDAVRHQLARTPSLDEAKISRLHEQWRAAKENSRAFALAPTMLDLVGRK